MNPPEHSSSVPARPSLDGLEDRWSSAWERRGIYRFDRSATRDRVFSIDTPPPTVSGSLHVGHVFSYTHTDVVARYRRMRGDVVFYPMGWDDNGLPTERRVETHYGVRCDPSLPYDPAFVPPAEPPKHGLAISRENFVELCARRTAEDEQVFEGLWRRLGLSVDWSITYTTIGAAARAASQRAFLRNLSRGEAYSALGPTMWDPVYRTAVAQAEIEDRIRPGTNVRLRFHPVDGDAPVAVDTTRPELLAACVALVAHPDDARYASLVGRQVRTPVFGATVPVYAHRLADPEKGTGLVMVCTFGNTVDLVWWRELNLDTRSIMGRNGWLLTDPPEGLTPEGRRAYRSSCSGRGVSAAREAVIGLLRDSGDLEGEPTAIEHAVTFYEKGHRPLEIVSTRQWYLRNGARDDVLRDTLLARGAELRWHPEHFRRRYDGWVRGLAGDWLVSRQRFFGVPIPVWYPLDDLGEPRYDTPLVPDEADLPVDPATACPPGYREWHRGSPGGFVADPDVMDTWATSSLTPQIAGGWERDPDLFERVFPMDLRPQAHEIIRTWLFSTVLRAHTEHGVLPWRNAVISGWVVDPERRKMSKSAGNVTTPENLLREYGSDAVRYWAASARPGTDTAFETRQMAIGRRLATKLLHAGRFVLSLGRPHPDDLAQLDPVDAALLADLADVVRAATAALDAFDPARALATVEAFFWTFCDDYLELVKDRAYGEAGDAAARRVRAVLRLALDVQLRLLAPVLPFVTEEVWSWWHHGDHGADTAGPEGDGPDAAGSIHRAAWPTPEELTAGGSAAPGALLADTAAVLRAVRGAKSRAKLSMRAPVRTVRVVGPPPAIGRLRAAAGDLRAAGVIGDLVLDVSGDDDTTTTELQIAVSLDDSSPAGAVRRRP